MRFEKTDLYTFFNADFKSDLNLVSMLYFFEMLIVYFFLLFLFVLAKKKLFISIRPVPHSDEIPAPIFKGLFL